jgi:hypothetical protein
LLVAVVVVTDVEKKAHLMFVVLHGFAQLELLDEPGSREGLRSK